MNIELPNCLVDYEPDLVLTVDDRRKLIKGLAEAGTKSIDIFIKQHSQDKRSGIAKLVEKLRNTIDKQLNSAREQIERKFRTQSEKIKLEHTKRFKHEQFEFGESNKANESSYIENEIDSRLMEILSNDETLNLIINFDDYSEEQVLTIWQRLKLAVLRFFKYLASLIKRFIAWLRKKLGLKAELEKYKEPIRKKAMSSILLNYPSGKEILENIDHNLDNVLSTSSEVRRIIDRDLNTHGKKIASGSKRITPNGSGRKSNYQDQVKQILEQRIKQAIKHERRRLQTQLERKKRRLKKLQKDKKHQELSKRELDTKIQSLEKQKIAQMEKLKNEYHKQIQRTVKKALENELEDAGYIQKNGRSELKITTRLIDRFAEIVLSDELQKLPGKYSFKTGIVGNPHGIYEKKKLRMAAESSRMDIVDTMVNARLAHPKERHIYDSDITTHVDIRGTISHVVLVFDKSGSMDENQRIIAAKKAVLALYKAVKHRNQRNIVDFIAFDSYVHIMDLLTAWHCQPNGFTNTSEALSTAYELVKNSRADNKLIYLITDGLPEAYTDPSTNEPRAGDLEKSLGLAVNEAKKFRKVTGLNLTIILLEPRERIYTDAANTIAQAAGGTVIVTDPKELATEMLTNYIEI